MKHYGPMERPWALFDVNNMLWKMVSWLTLKRIMTPAFLTCYWQKSAQRVFLPGVFLRAREPATSNPDLGEAETMKHEPQRYRV